MLMVKSLIFLLITIIMLYSKLNIKWKDKQETVLQKDVEIMVRLKYLSNFGRILEMSLINCEINWNLVLKEQLIGINS